MSPESEAAAAAVVYMAWMYPHEWTRRELGEDDARYRARAVVHALDRERFFKER